MKACASTDYNELRKYIEKMLYQAYSSSTFLEQFNEYMIKSNKLDDKQKACIGQQLGVSFAVFNELFHSLPYFMSVRAKTKFVLTKNQITICIAVDFIQITRWRLRIRPIIRSGDNGNESAQNENNIEVTYLLHFNDAFST